MELMFNFSPDVGIVPDKDMILNKVSEEELWTYYGCPIQKAHFCSKLREDHNPTVSLTRTRNGRIYYKDFGYPGHAGDIFWYVATLYNTNFIGALRIIANDFGIVKTSDPPHMAQIEYNGEKVTETQGAIIKCEIQPFTKEELKWWAQYGIDVQTLNKYDIYSVKNVWLNGNLFHIHNPKQMVFGYYGGKDEDGVEKWRVYFPAGPCRKKKTFINNWPSSMVQGMSQMPKDGDVLFIQKALKDVASMSALGYQAIAPNSENTALDDSIIAYLEAHFKRLIVFMDNDTAGIASMAKMAEKHPEIEYYHLPENGPKDLSDYIKAYGKDKARELIEREFFSSKEREEELPEDW